MSNTRLVRPDRRLCPLCGIQHTACPTISWGRFLAIVFGRANCKCVDEWLATARGWPRSPLRHLANTTHTRDMTMCSLSFSIQAQANITIHHHFRFHEWPWSYLHTTWLQYCNWIFFFVSELPYSYPFRNASLPNEGHFGNFVQNWLQWQRFLRNWKKRSRSIIYEQIPIIWWNDCEIRSSGSWDNWSPSDH